MLLLQVTALGIDEPECTGRIEHQDQQDDAAAGEKNTAIHALQSTGWSMPGELWAGSRTRRRRDAAAAVVVVVEVVHHLLEVLLGLGGRAECLIDRFGVAIATELDLDRVTREGGSAELIDDGQYDTQIIGAWHVRVIVFIFDGVPVLPVCIHRGKNGFSRCSSAPDWRETAQESGGPVLSGYVTFAFVEEVVGVDQVEPDGGCEHALT